MVPESSTDYTWEDAVAAVGLDLSGGEDMVADEVVEYTSVVRFCEPWEIGNPIHWDKRIARQAGYRNVVVPVSAVKQTFVFSGAWRPGQPTRFPVGMDKNAAARQASYLLQARPLPFPPTSQGFFTDAEIEFFEPVCVGDRLTVKGNKVISVRTRKTRVGYGAFYNRENLVYNQRGELVARANQGSYAYNPE